MNHAPPSSASSESRQSHRMATFEPLAGHVSGSSHHQHHQHHQQQQQQQRHHHHPQNLNTAGNSRETAPAPSLPQIQGHDGHGEFGRSHIPSSGAGVNQPPPLNEYDDDEEDRQSDDGSEVDPGYNEIEIWLQRCSICFDARLDFCLEFCRDQFCRDCFQRYVKEVVSNSWGLNITKIKCPVCQDTIPISEWTRYVDQATLTQYHQYNQPYRSFSRFCNECGQEAVVSEIKRKVIGLPARELMPFFEALLVDLKALLHLGGLELDSNTLHSSTSPSQNSSTRTIPKTAKQGGPRVQEKDVQAQRIIQKFMDDYRSFCGALQEHQLSLPSMAQSYLSSLTFRTLVSPAAQAAQTAITLPPPSHPHHHHHGSSSTAAQSSQARMNVQHVQESAIRPPSSLFQQRRYHAMLDGVLGIYKTLMVSLLDLFDLSQSENPERPGYSPSAGNTTDESGEDHDVDMDHDANNTTLAPPAMGGGNIAAATTETVIEARRKKPATIHHGSKSLQAIRSRMMTRAESKRQMAIKRALVRLSKDMSSLETRPDQWKELQFLHVRWLRWDWCHSCDLELCMQCGESSHHEQKSCSDFMRTMIAGGNAPISPRRKRNSKANDRLSTPSEKSLSKRKDHKDLDANTIQWKLANTNPCPNCCILIHRDDGCNKVDCMLCGYRFCWICRQAWGVSCGFFKCGQQATPQDALPDVQKSEDANEAIEDGDDGNPTGATSEGDQVLVLAVSVESTADIEAEQAGVDLSRQERRRRRVDDLSTSTIEKPEIGVPDVFGIQAKRSRT
ncbi:E3 ubiquitin-protein ligase arih2 [Mortierella polycephala]|uniref:E3 ubiquitin-protein ligase arih2 n=1 Tax=Mortierella polycephala TaxID=41804 RepID=A0A9P6U208_9FUNG|nr:E3 ubiquitin-protein ligase arih2 [Mortierella polycephala]